MKTLLLARHVYTDDSFSGTTYHSMLLHLHPDGKACSLIKEVDGIKMQSVEFEFKALGNTGLFCADMQPQGQGYSIMRLGDQLICSLYKGLEEVKREVHDMDDICAGLGVKLYIPTAEDIGAYESDGTISKDSELKVYG